MQQDRSERERNETYIPNLEQSVPDNSPYSKYEWQTLVETPIKVGRAMMAVSPSGAIGMAQEVMALRKCYAEAFQNTSNPVLLSLRQHLQNQDTMQSIWEHAGRAFGDRWDATNVRQTALQACQHVNNLLQKISPQDARAYKDFLYNTALKIAEAAREGGFMGMGGVAVSEEEKVMLADISNTLGIAHS
jgi:hypothetical protein